MKTIIYYFTGTGNSLAAAKKIAAALGSTELVPVASLKNIPGRIIPAADRVGIVSPVYDAGVPRIIAEFAERLSLSRAGYTFAIARNNSKRILGLQSFACDEWKAGITMPSA